MLLFTIVVLIITALYFLVKWIKHKCIYCPSVGSNLNIAKFANELRKDFGPNIEFNKIIIHTPDKEQLSALRAHNPKTKTWILFAHGNGANMYYRTQTIKQFLKFSSVLMFDYRGYGDSTGNPSEQGLYTDIYEVWSYLINTGVKPENVIMYGESLGAAVVLHHARLLSENNTIFGGLILQCGFSSIRNYIRIKTETILSSSSKSTFVVSNLAKLIRAIAGDEYNSVFNIAHIYENAPVLISHSPYDEVTEFEHSQILLKACKSEKIEFYKLNGSHCPGLYDIAYLNKINEFITKHIS
jgi:hypothetical protein